MVDKRATSRQQMGVAVSGEIAAASEGYMLAQHDRRLGFTARNVPLTPVLCGDVELAKLVRLKVFHRHELFSHRPIYDLDRHFRIHTVRSRLDLASTQADWACRQPVGICNAVDG